MTIDVPKQEKQMKTSMNKKIFLVPQHRLGRRVKPRYIGNYKGEMDFSTIEDSPHIGRLERRIYPKEWLVSDEFQSRILAVNPYVDRVLHTPYGVKGVYSFIPLAKEPYEAVLSGEIDEDDLPDYILPYHATEEQDVYLYLYSIIVDIHDGPRRKQYAKSLLRDMPSYFEMLDTLGVNVKEIGAITISRGGYRITKSIGFKHTDDLTAHGKVNRVMRASVDDVRQSIDVDKLTGY